MLAEERGRREGPRRSPRSYERAYERSLRGREERADKGGREEREMGSCKRGARMKGVRGAGGGQGLARERDVSLTHSVSLTQTDVHHGQAGS